MSTNPPTQHVTDAGTRVTLRLLDDTDLDVFHAMLAQDDNREWTTAPVDATREECLDIIRNTRHVHPPEITWGIEVEDEGLAGIVLLTGYRTNDRSVRLAYWVGRDFHGRGIAGAACRQAVEHAWEDPRIDTVRWDARVGNEASWRVVRRLGFVFTGLQRATPFRDGVTDVWMASLRRGEPMEPVSDVDEPWRVTRALAPYLLDSSLARLSEHPAKRSAGDSGGVRPYDPRIPAMLVRQFHELYQMPIAHTDVPRTDFDRIHMRMSLIAEEFAELTGALYGSEARAAIEAAAARARDLDDQTRDTVEVADALADLVYVIYGMAIECGIDLDRVLDEVQASNLSKLGADGKPILREDGKILKGPGFFPPDVAGTLGLGGTDTDTDEGR